MKKLLFLLFLVTTGCTQTIDLNVALDLEDPCLFRFPQCDASDGSYSCVNVEGVEFPDCEVVCIAAAGIACTVDGPTCYNAAGPEEINVPVLCMSDSI